MMRLLIGIMALWLCLPHPLAVAGQAPHVELQGAFAVTIAAEDVPPELIDGASLIGRWRVTFNADGTYLLGRQDVGILVTGQFQTDGDQVTLRAETGVLACASGGQDDEAATYSWEISENRLLLIAIDEPCARRRLLLTTRALSSFEACPPAVRLSATPAGAPAAATGTPALEPTEGAIDTLLRQLSDCWATRDPDRFLPLLSHDLRATQQPDDADDVRRLTLRMGAPLVWERVSDVELIDATHATATVRQTSGDNVDVLRYRFTFEVGAWRWDGIIESP